jgi:hypothetical protein
MVLRLEETAMVDGTWGGRKKGTSRHDHQGHLEKYFCGPYVERYGDRRDKRHIADVDTKTSRSRSRIQSANVEALLAMETYYDVVSVVLSNSSSRGLYYHSTRCDWSARLLQYHDNIGVVQF